MAEITGVVVDEGYTVPPIIRSRFRSATLVYLRSDGKKIIGNAFEIAQHESIDEIELLSAVVGEGDLDNGFIFML